MPVLPLDNEAPEARKQRAELLARAAASRTSTARSSDGRGDFMPKRSYAR